MRQSGFQGVTLIPILQSPFRCPPPSPGPCFHRPHLITRCQREAHASKTSLNGRKGQKRPFQRDSGDALCSDQSLANQPSAPGHAIDTNTTKADDPTTFSSSLHLKSLNKTNLKGKGIGYSTAGTTTVNVGVGNNSKLKRVRKSVDELVKKLKPLLSRAAHGFSLGSEIDPEIERCVLEIMPEIRVNDGEVAGIMCIGEDSVLASASARTNAQNDEDEEQQQIIESESAASQESTSGVYNAELSAILEHFKKSQIQKKEVCSNSNGTEVFPHTQSQQRIGIGTLVLLMRLISDTSGPQSALLLYKILEKRHPQVLKSSRLVELTVRLMINDGYSQGGIALLREAVLEQGRNNPRIQYNEAFREASRSNRPDLFLDLIKELESQKFKLPSEINANILRAHKEAGNIQAAMKTIKDMIKSGEKRASMFATLVSFANTHGDVALALKAMEWAAEKDCLKGAVWWQLLLMSTNTQRVPELMDTVLDELERRHSKVSCGTVHRVLSSAFDSGQPQGAFMLFEKLRNRKLISNLPLPTNGNDNILRSGKQYLTLGGREYEQIEIVHELESEEDEEKESEEDEDEGITPSKDEDEEGSTGNNGSHAITLYSNVICAAHKGRLTSKMKLYYEWMHEDGVKPNRAIMTRMVACCPYEPNPQEYAIELYQYICKLGMEMDAFMYGHLVNALLTGPRAKSYWDIVLLLTHRMQVSTTQMSNDTSMQTSIAVQAGKNGWLRQLLTLYRLMLQDGVMPRLITWNAFISAAQRCNRPDIGYQFGAAMRKMGCQKDAATHSALLSCTATQKNGKKAMEQWEEMIQDGVVPDVIACTSYMWACLNGGKADETVRFFEAWRRDGVPPGWKESNEKRLELTKINPSKSSVFSPAAALGLSGNMRSFKNGQKLTFSNVCTFLVQSKSGRWSESRTALALQRWIRQQGEDPSSLTLEGLNEKASTRGGRWEEALEIAQIVESRIKEASNVQKAAPELDPVAISFAVTAYANVGQTDCAHQLASELASMDLPLHKSIFSTALDACAGLGAVDATIKLMRRARSAGIRPDDAAFTAAILAAVPTGNVPMALKVLDWMTEDGNRLNIIAVNSALSVCTAAGDVDQALAIFWRMLEEWNLAPDVVAYATLSEAMAKSGKWDSAVRALLVSEATKAPFDKTMRSTNSNNNPIRSPNQGAYRNAITLAPTNYAMVKTGDMLYFSHLAKEPPVKEIDLHGLSVANASAFVRAWLIVLKYSPTFSSCEYDGSILGITTGWGRNSQAGIARVKPAIEELLETFHIEKLASSRQGHIELDAKVVREALKTVDLGFESEIEEKELFQLLTRKRPISVQIIPRPSSSTRDTSDQGTAENNNDGQDKSKAQPGTNPRKIKKSNSI